MCESTVFIEPSMFEFLLQRGLRVGGLLLSCGILAIALPRPAIAAEHIYFAYGPLLFSLSIDALETYVEEGRITPEFAPYANQLEEEMLAQLRQDLQASMP